MSLPRALAVLLVVGLGAYVWTAYAGAQQDGNEVPAPEAGPVLVDPSTWGGYVDDIQDAIYDLGSEVGAMNESTSNMQQLDPDANVRAFLETIKLCEGTAGQSDPYRVCFGYSHVVQNMADHPAVTGEWRGKTLSDAQCAGAGRGPGCVSTAAGAYQMVRGTWSPLKARLGLPDFMPASQDAAAVELLRECGALGRLAVGDLAGAVSRARRIWASLPGANYAGQGMRSMGQVQAWYSGNGGAVA